MRVVDAKPGAGRFFVLRVKQEEVDLQGQSDGVLFCWERKT